jgi:hypothetical protein
MEDSDKLSFASRHKKEMDPLQIDHDLGRDIERGNMSDVRLDDALQRFETKILVYETENADAPRVLLEASQPANYTILSPLIHELQHDPNCGGITLLTDNLAGQSFAHSLVEFSAVRKEGKPVAADIPAGPYNAALVLSDVENSPMQLLLHSAKNVFETKKLCFYEVAIYGEQLREMVQSPKSHINPIDRIFAADEFTKDLICEGLDIPDEKILVAGSPLIDSINTENAEALRSAGRAKLGISERARVALYNGFPSIDFVPYGGESDLNIKTYQETLNGLIEAAQSQPEIEFACIVRTHPRARNTEILPNLPPNVPLNLLVVSGDMLVTYEEAVYASDVICCAVSSTETLLAAYRGRQAAVFAYPGEHQHGEINERLYGRKGMTSIETSGRAAIIDSSTKLAALLSSLVAREPLKKPSIQSDLIKRELLS